MDTLGGFKMIKLANDLGNGNIKATIDGEHVVFPSVIARLREQDIQDPVVLSSKMAANKYFDHILDHLDITVSSSAVKTGGRYLFGKAAVDSPLDLIGFDINDYVGKSETDLSVILTLGLIAGKRVKEAFLNGELDGNNLTLQTDVAMTTALPISEAKKPGVAVAYSKRYLGRTHTVTINNFKDPITVQIKFDMAQVALEGEIAHLYIVNGPEDLKNGIYEDFKAHYPEAAKLIDADQLVKTKNALTLDIGADTADIAIIKDGVADARASLSAHQGYGWVLEQAIDVLQSQQINFEDRTKLQEYLDAPTDPLGMARKKRVQKVVDEQVEPLVDKIVLTVSRAVRNSNASLNLMFVHGGGSIPLAKNSDLREKLENKLKSFTGGDDFYIVFVPEGDAAYCNERGLELFLKAMVKDKG